VYSRHFFPLFPETAGYDFGGKAASGNVLIEQRELCKLTLQVQNLRPGRYDVYAFFPGGAVNFGAAEACARGRVRLRCENVGEGDPLAVAILPYGATVGAAMAGFAGDRVPLRIEIPKPTPKPEPEPPPIPESIPEPIPEPEPPPVTEPEPEPEPPPTPEPEPAPEPEPEPTPQPEPPPAPEAVAAPAAKRPHNVYDEAIAALFDGKKPVKPFEFPQREVAWVHVSITDDIPLPPCRPRLLEDHFVRSAYASANHLLLGLTVDDGPRMFILGLPGEHDPAIAPPLRRLGFTEHMGGYWLMMVDM
jgi:hypothetical protein